MHTRAISGGAGSRQHGTRNTARAAWSGAHPFSKSLSARQTPHRECSPQHFPAISKYIRPEEAWIPHYWMFPFPWYVADPPYSSHPFQFRPFILHFPGLNSYRLDIRRCLPYTWHLSAMLNLEWLSSDPCKRHVISSLMGYLLNTGGEKDNPFPSFFHLKDKSLYLHCLEN